MTDDKYQPEDNGLDEAEIERLKKLHETEIRVRRATRVCEYLIKTHTSHDFGPIEPLIKRAVKLPDFQILRIEREMDGTREFKTRTECHLAIQEYENQRQSLQEKLDTTLDKTKKQELLKQICEYKVTAICIMGVALLLGCRRDRPSVWVPVRRALAVASLTQLRLPREYPSTISWQNRELRRRKGLRQDNIAREAEATGEFFRDCLRYAILGVNGEVFDWHILHCDNGVAALLFCVPLRVLRDIGQIEILGLSALPPARPLVWFPSLVEECLCRIVCCAVIQRHRTI